MGRSPEDSGYTRIAAMLARQDESLRRAVERLKAAMTRVDELENEIAILQDWVRQLSMEAGLRR